MVEKVESFAPELSSAKAVRQFLDKEAVVYTLNHIPYTLLYHITLITLYS
jgi:predicted dinucleotide-binding enzyme